MIVFADAGGIRGLTSAESSGSSIMQLPQWPQQGKKQQDAGHF